MAKAEINNEIVLLRHTVRQARLCVINKLIKEARRLRNKHGNEIQQEKYKKKADKLIDEIQTLKRIKDDDISKFGIINERELAEILQDPTSTNDIRIKARVTYYKTLHKRLTQFKDKYPDCKKYVMEKEEKKKSTKLRTNNVAKTKHSSKENNSVAHNKTPRKQTVNSDQSTEERSQNDSRGEKACETASKEVRNKENSHKKRKKSTSDESMSSNEGKVQKLEKEDELQESVVDKQPNVNTIKSSVTIKPCSITKEGTVKRFTELLEEQETHKQEKEDAQTCAESPEVNTTERAQVVDDFFVTEDNENYKTNNRVSIQQEKSHKYNTRTKAFQSNNRTNKQDKNDTNFDKKYSDKQSSGKKKKTITMKLKKISNETNKGTNKNNSTNATDKEEDANLHPSWLAKMKEREMLKQGFQGKKIKFTDD
ncbi:MATH and LRR domain-containing protein PFE0570w-like [Pseudomyrmex gracilis]|uniref:MATH and LRR domain-containing protein PFE0570w-like n=1 Tax=Pseudomyrmex gracilis TaxID=219809 RepID=UPI00099530B1|nr:MATH and LRR domain-containing protein PFE0570w-like [Pseudomyrmex gracilis]